VIGTLAVYYALGLVFMFVTGSIVSFIAEVVEIRLDRKEEQRRRRSRISDE
jgi:hypothetical protein